MSQPPPSPLTPLVLIALEELRKGTYICSLGIKDMAWSVRIALGTGVSGSSWAVLCVFICLVFVSFLLPSFLLCQFCTFWVSLVVGVTSGLPGVQSQVKKIYATQGLPSFKLWLERHATMIVLILLLSEEEWIPGTCVELHETPSLSTPWFYFLDSRMCQEPPLSITFVFQSI